VKLCSIFTFPLLVLAYLGQDRLSPVWADYPGGSHAFHHPCHLIAVGASGDGHLPGV